MKLVFLSVVTGSSATSPVTVTAYAFAAGSIARNATNPKMRKKFFMQTSKPHESTTLLLRIYAVFGEHKSRAFAGVSRRRRNVR